VIDIIGKLPSADATLGPWNEVQALPCIVSRADAWEVAKEPAPAAHAGTSVLYMMGMSQRIRQLVSVCRPVRLRLCTAEGRRIRGTVEITLRSPTAAAGVPVKIVDEAAVAKALGTLACSRTLKTPSRRRVYSDFFNTLTCPRDERGENKQDGRILVKHVGAPYYVVAQEGQHLWVPTAAEVHDSRLPMGSE